MDDVLTQEGPHFPLRSEFDRVVAMRYTNHRGETATRKVLPIRLWFGESPWHTGDQWFLQALDVEKNEERSFAMGDVHEWGVERQPDVRH